MIKVVEIISKQAKRCLLYARKISQIADSRRHLRRGCGTLTYRRSRKKGRKAPVTRTREVTATRHRQLFLVFLFAVSQFFFLQSSLFVVRDITVEGQKKTDKKTILQAMGLGEDARYWSLSPNDLTNEVLELHQLESASVEVLFPSRVSVTVRERQPVFSVASIGKSQHAFLVDKDGVILGAGKAPAGAVSMVVDRPVKLGGQLTNDELEVATYLQTHLRPTLAKRLERIKFNKRGDVALRIRYGTGGFWVRLGRPEKLSYKLVLLEELIASLKAESADFASIDLRYSTPVVRKKFQAPPAGQAAEKL